MEVDDDALLLDVPDDAPDADAAADDALLEFDEPTDAPALTSGEADGAPTADHGSGGARKRFSGKRRVIEHTWDANAMMGVDPSAPEEQARRAARAAKFGLDDGAVAPAPAAEPAEMLTMEEVQSRAERAAKFGMEARDPLSVLDRQPGNDAYWERRRDAADDEEPRPEAIHVFGTDKMSTEDLLRYFMGVPSGDPRAVEWVNDSAANVTFVDADAARAALEARTVPLLPGTEDRLDAFTWRTQPADRPTAGKGLQLIFRLATVKDIKPPKRAASRWYGEAKGRGGPARNKGGRGRGARQRAEPYAKREKRTLEDAMAVPQTLDEAMARATAPKTLDQIISERGAATRGSGPDLRGALGRKGREGDGDFKRRRREPDADAAMEEGGGGGAAECFDLRDRLGESSRKKPTGVFSYEAAERDLGLGEKSSEKTAEPPKADEAPPAVPSAVEATADGTSAP